MASKISKSKGGNKKHGRNEIFCKAYRSVGRREKNKIVKLRRHLENYPDDGGAISRLKELGG